MSTQSMVALVRHLWNEQQDKIVAESRLNCHVKGLHSIMLLNSPGQTIRMFYTAPNSEMDEEMDWNGQVALGIHPHHCNLTLHCIFGRLENHLFGFDGNTCAYFSQLDCYRWESALLGKGGRFVEHGNEVDLYHHGIEDLVPGDSTYMRADQLHTVTVPSHRASAWLVFEGAEDPNYSGLCFSNIDLTQFSTEGLYLPATKPDIENILVTCGLL